MPGNNNQSGAAALSICEALLLALNDHKVLPEREIMGVLEDSAAANENVPEPDDDRLMHQATANIIRKIITGGNSVRRP